MLIQFVYQCWWEDNTETCGGEQGRAMLLTVVDSIIGAIWSTAVPQKGFGKYAEVGAAKWLKRFRTRRHDLVFGLGEVAHSFGRCGQGLDDFRRAERQDYYREIATPCEAVERGGSGFGRHLSAVECGRHCTK